MPIGTRKTSIPTGQCMDTGHAPLLVSVAMRPATCSNLALRVCGSARPRHHEACQDAPHMQACDTRRRMQRSCRPNTLKRSDRIETLQQRFACPLLKDDTHTSKRARRLPVSVINTGVHHPHAPSRWVVAGTYGAKCLRPVQRKSRCAAGAERTQTCTPDPLHVQSLYSLMLNPNSAYSRKNPSSARSCSGGLSCMPSGTRVRHTQSGHPMSDVAAPPNPKTH